MLFSPFAALYSPPDLRKPAQPDLPLRTPLPLGAQLRLDTESACVEMGRTVSKAAGLQIY